MQRVSATGNAYTIAYADVICKRLFEDLHRVSKNEVPTPADLAQSIINWCTEFLVQSLKVNERY